MDITSQTTGQEAAIEALFRAVFTASEGASEGTAVGTLARGLMASTPPQDIHVFAGTDEGQIIAAVIFTRLHFGNGPRQAFLLSPMAVATNRQGEGLGQALIRYGLTQLQANGAQIAVTYGDPAFYEKLGFRPAKTDTLPAPYPLSQPHGWIAQSLTGSALAPLPGPCTCAPALMDPAFW